MMKAEVGATCTVTGRRSAMVSAGPMPGSTPMAVPSAAPTKAQNRLMGCSATPKPCAREPSASITSNPESGKEAAEAHAEPREAEIGEDAQSRSEPKVEERAPRPERAHDECEGQG